MSRHNNSFLIMDEHQYFSVTNNNTNDTSNTSNKLRREFLHGISAPIKQIVMAGDKFMFILAEDGKVYCIGCDHQYVPSTDHNRHFRLHPALSQYTIRRIFKGESSVLFLTMDNQVLIYGSSSYNKYGEYTHDRDTTGLYKLSDSNWCPQSPDEQVTWIAPCYSSCVFVTDQRNIYVLGQYFWFFAAPVSETPYRLDTNSPVVSGGSGYFHAVLLTEDGNVWVGGENTQSLKRGIIDCSIDKFFSLNKENNMNEKFTLAIALTNYSVFATESRKVFLAGDEFMSHFGKRVDETGLFLVELNLSTPIVDVSLSYTRFIISTADKVYSTQSCHARYRGLASVVADDPNDNDVLSAIDFEFRDHVYNKLDTFGGVDVLYPAALHPSLLIPRHFKRPMRAFHDVAFLFEQSQ